MVVATCYADAGKFSWQSHSLVLWLSLVRGAAVAGWVTQSVTGWVTLVVVGWVNVQLVLFQLQEQLCDSSNATGGPCSAQLFSEVSSSSRERIQPPLSRQ